MTNAAAAPGAAAPQQQPHLAAALGAVAVLAAALRPPAWASLALGVLIGVVGLCALQVRGVTQSGVRSKGPHKAS
jgi:hypothetical protein